MQDVIVKGSRLHAPARARFANRPRDPITPTALESDGNGCRGLIMSNDT